MTVSSESTRGVARLIAYQSVSLTTTAQAVLPLRGKILNVERSDDASMYKNNELSNLIVALGLGTKGSEGVDDSLRYGKLIILTDADVDGAHIRTLLLTFLFR